jgi:hypothetical protein
VVLWYVAHQFPILALTEQRNSPSGLPKLAEELPQRMSLTLGYSVRSPAKSSHSSAFGYTTPGKTALSYNYPQICGRWQRLGLAMTNLRSRQETQTALLAALSRIKSSAALHPSSLPAPAFRGLHCPLNPGTAHGKYRKSMVSSGI